MQKIVNDCVDPTSYNYHHDRHNDHLRGRIAKRRRAVAALKTSQTSRDRYQSTLRCRLHETAREIHKGQRRDRLTNV